MIIRLATSKDKKQVLKLFDEFSMLLGGKERPSQIGKVIFDEIILLHELLKFLNIIKILNFLGKRLQKVLMTNLKIRLKNYSKKIKVINMQKTLYLKMMIFHFLDQIK